MKKFRYLLLIIPLLFFSPLYVSASSGDGSETYPIQLSCSNAYDFGGACSITSRSLYVPDSSGVYSREFSNNDYTSPYLLKNDSRNYPIYLYSVANGYGSMMGYDVTYWNYKFTTDKKYKLVIEYTVPTKDSNSYFLDKDIYYKYITLNTVTGINGRIPEVDVWKYGETSASLLYFNFGITREEVNNTYYSGYKYLLTLEIQPRVNLYGLQFGFKPIEESCSSTSPTCNVDNVISVGSSTAGIINYEHAYPILEYGYTNDYNCSRLVNFYEVDDFTLTTSIVGSLPGVDDPDNNPGSDNSDVIGKLDDINKTQQSTNDKLDEAENTRKGIWQTIKDLPGQLLNMLKSLFIPSDDYFSSKFDELKDNFNNVLGFLSYPLTLITKTFNFLLTVEDSGSYVISWNDVTVPNFEDHIIIHSGTFDLGQLLENNKVATLRNIAFIFINGLLLLAFLQLCHNKYSELFGGDISTTEYITVSDNYTVDYSTGEVSKRRSIRHTVRSDIT